MKRVSLWILGIAALAFAAIESSNPQPGRNRPEPPAQFELGRQSSPNNKSQFNRPTEAEPEPAPDPRISSALRMTDDTRSNDFPVIASNPKNRDEVWCGWLSYSGRADEFRLARYDAATKSWGAWNRVPESNGDIWRPQLAFDGQGRVWAIWAMQVNNNFDLYARWFDGKTWGPLERLSSAPQSDFDAQAASDSQGRVWVAWQGFRNGQSDIFLTWHDGKKWAPEMLISDSPRNDWEPAIAVDSRGHVVVAWDTYDRGNYDVRMRTYANGKLSPVVAVAATPRLEIRPTVAFDKKDQLWIAYETGPVNWAKDNGATIPDAKTPGSFIYGERHVEVVAYSGDRRLGMAPDVGAKLPRRNKKVYVPSSEPIVGGARIIAGDDGRIHMLIRNQHGSDFATYFREYVTTLTDKGWTNPAVLPYSVGRLSMRAAAAPAADGSLWLAWPRDNDPKFSIFLNLPEETIIENVYTGRYSPGAASSDPRLEAREPVVTPARAPHDDAAEADRVRAIRAYRSKAGKAGVRILRGDIHRHTEFSPDMRSVPDGSFLDFYRYMLDAASMDWGMISDHQAGGDREYWWWLGQKATDLFYSPPNYVSMYGYERSVSYPNGHRNIVHTKRGYTAVPFFQGFQLPFRSHNGGHDVIDGDTKMLYDEIRRSGGIAVSHTSATTMGTDWRDNDKDLEPVVEIFQGDRYSYECGDCPLADTRKVPDDDLQAPRPKGFVHNAWAKGYRLGVIASSDHVSTHMSYALIYAEDYTRDAVQNALRRRHTYAATDNIIVDYKLGDHFMGEEFDAKSVPPVLATIEGTAPVKEVSVIRNNQVIYQTSPKERTVRLRYQDMQPAKGLTYYYLRVVQQDGNVAWSSPIWINIK